MRVLAIDIGNTKLAAGLLDGTTVLETHRETIEERGAPDEAAQRVARIFAWCRARQQADAAIEGLALSSVVPALLEVWSHLWEGAGGPSPLPTLLVDAQTYFPFVVDVAQPETVGADRYCNVAAAVARGLEDALVVDVGTANTYDVLRKGAFLGGLIAPGLVTAHRALLAAAAQLPSLDFRRTEDVIGRTTEEAIRAGSYHQGVGGVLHVVDALRRGHGDLPLLLTGGLAGEVMGPLQDRGYGAEWIADLTLEGAAFLFRVSRPRRDGADSPT